MKRRAASTRRHRLSLGLGLGWHALAAVAVTAYFAFHFVAGDRGALALLEARATLAVVEAERAEAATAEEALRKRVALLRPSTLDADMLEEQARRLLNFAADADYVLHTPRARPATASR